MCDERKRYMKDRGAIIGGITVLCRVIVYY